MVNKNVVSLNHQTITIKMKNFNVTSVLSIFKNSIKVIFGGLFFTFLISFIFFIITKTLTIFI